MKINRIKSIIAIGISGLISFGYYHFHETENKLLLCLGSFIFLAITLIFSFGVSFPETRTSTNVKMVSGIFFLIACSSNLAFSISNFSPPIYIISNGILLLVYTLISYSIRSAKQ